MEDYNSAPSRGFVWGAAIATLIVVAVLAFVFRVVTPAGPAASGAGNSEPAASTPGATASGPAAAPAADAAPAANAAPATATAASAATGAAGTASTEMGTSTTGAATDQAQAGRETRATAPDQDRADAGGTSQAAASEETQTMQVSFTGDTGAALYVQACQSCHMPGGRGAEGAGHYPALANNARVASTPYVTSLILNGNGGMPGFGHYLSDTQIAMIVNYVRGTLNKQDSDVQPQEIKELRPKNPNYLIFGESAG